MARGRTTGRLNGVRVLITAGPTHEYVDDVRYIGNPSTGRMGIALALAARAQGADVVVVCGPTHLAPPPGVPWVPVVSAEEMLAAVRERFDECQVFIASAAVADYRPAARKAGKIKKGPATTTLKLKRNPDILKTMARRKDGRVLVGFSLESADALRHARKKVADKHCDLMVVNSPGHFGEAREHVRVITPRGLVAEIPPVGKDEVARQVITFVAELVRGRKLPLLRPFAEGAK
jgi:phosphopantothenoylcysteine decarboxylase / phosphopantothenate---cysteine ligase